MPKVGSGFSIGCISYSFSNKSSFGFKTIIFFLILLIYIPFLYAGETEDLEVAKSLYDAKNYKDAKTAFQDFMNKYPNSKDFSVAKAFDIKCDYRFANYTMFNQKLDEFKSQYPDHPLMY